MILQERSYGHALAHVTRNGVFLHFYVVYTRNKPRMKCQELTALSVLCFSNFVTRKKFAPMTANQQTDET